MVSFLVIFLKEIWLYNQEKIIIQNLTILPNKLKYTTYFLYNCHFVRSKQHILDNDNYYIMCYSSFTCLHLVRLWKDEATNNDSSPSLFHQFYFHHNDLHLYNWTITTNCFTRHNRSSLPPLSSPIFSSLSPTVSSSFSTYCINNKISSSTTVRHTCFRQSLFIPLEEKR